MKKVNLNTKARKSDILRYLYLYYEGGVYFDLDYDFDEKCLNFISKLYISDYEVIVGESQFGNDYAKSSNFIEANPIFAKLPKNDRLFKILTETNWPEFNHFSLVNIGLTVVKFR